jgi:hypothetical protein
VNNLRKPEIPAAPALPRFGSDHFDRQVDALDVAATAQRPTVRPGRGGQVHVRKKIAADATAEVQVEDILIEVYAEEPPPPLTRRSPGVPVASRDVLSESGEARDSIAMAIASVVPPPPAQSAAVDALLRASDPAFAPFPGHMHAYGTRPSFAGADYETPSVGPMMMATTPPPARPVLGDARDKRAMRRATALAVWATVIMVVGVAAGAAMMMALRNGTYARLRESAKTALRASSKPEAPVAAASPRPAVTAAPAIAAAPAVAAAPAAPAVAAAPVVPTMSVDALPKPAVAADVSLVTLPAYAEGHRVFLDGRVLSVAPGTPTAIKCGRHMLKIGSTRRARSVDFACGREVIVQ